MGLPACTGLGEATFVTDKFGPEVPTMVVTVAALLDEFGSETDELTWAVPVITVPLATPVFTFTTIVNVADVRPAMLAFVQKTLPALFEFVVRQLHPAGTVSETNVVLAGTGATNVALSAALGPLLVTTWV